MRSALQWLAFAAAVIIVAAVLAFVVGAIIMGIIDSIRGTRPRDRGAPRGAEPGPTEDD